jgi:hypothetical protein
MKRRVNIGPHRSHRQVRPDAVKHRKDATIYLRKGKQQITHNAQRTAVNKIDRNARERSSP